MKRGTRKIVLVWLLGLVMVGGLVVSAEASDSMLRWVIDYPVSVDPCVGMPKFVSFQAHVNTYSPLVYPTTDGGVKPHVAERWEKSEDGLTYTFYLRPGILFSNGHELMADDVAFSFERLMTIGEQSAYHFKGTFESVEVVDDYTVRIHLEKTYGPFLKALIAVFILDKGEVTANVVEPGPYGEFGDYGTEYLRSRSVGSGAYMVKEFDPRDHLILEKNPYHSFESSPHSPDLVRIGSNIDPVAVQTMIKNRELEISDRWQPAESLAIMERFEGVEVDGWLAPSVLDLMLNTRKAPTDDIHIRKALSWAFDYETGVEIFPGYILTQGPVPSDLPGWNPDVFQYRQDLDKAKEEVAKSKYAGKLDEYPIELSIWSGSVALEKLALLFQANAAMVGLKVEIISQPQGVWFDNMSHEETTHHITLCWNMASYPDAGARLLKYHSGAAGTHEGCEWLLDPELDELIVDAIQTADDDERTTKYYALQDMIVDLAPTIWANQEFERHAYQAHYVNWPQLEKPLPVIGYNFDARFIEVFPEKRQELLGK